MKKISLILVLSSIMTFAQSDLRFDKKFVLAIDNWVAFQADSLGNHMFGFVYLDPHAGLTLDYSGSFKIEKNGKYSTTKKENVGSIKYRLQPNNTLVALIAENKVKELEEELKPKWLESYKSYKDSVEILYQRGFLLNAWNECETALEFLKKAENINSNFKGLQTEIAFSYNALKKYELAEKALLKSLKNNSTDCYTLKELAYTYQNLKKLEQAEEVFHKMKKCKEINYIQETAYNLTYRYFELNDKKNFQKWNAETRKLNPDQRIIKNLDTMEKKFGTK